ncbi:unnamed protein product [Bemisia tabaci]|uniref:Uncharacterized protein n=1 Tax=Bemisia tabaci TaxID=7038 RepID=A0A9P0AAU5_BEMTA|nr:PREDICTED: U3 small nucleolar RNA-interacting protein 2 [Bemisia tabaci]CAH0386950.1 unnamed protein product [Bemisia tabaci]
MVVRDSEDSEIQMNSDREVVYLKCKEHKLPITCLALSPDGKFLFSASKDCNIVKWCLTSKLKVGSILSKHKSKHSAHQKHAHSAIIYCLAVAPDNKFLASGDASGTLNLWNPETLVHLSNFKGHKAAVTGVAFCSETNQLYSGSSDRTVNVWNLTDLCFIETLHGHQTGITDVDIMSKDRVITSGGSDNTVRLWKIDEESQLIYAGHKRNIDLVRRLTNQIFVSAGDDGIICLWGISKKKPRHTVENAHGIDVSNGEPNWIYSLCTVSNQNLVCSGSNDGFVRVWRCDGFCSLVNIKSIPINGFINSLCYSSDQSCLIAAVGQEPKLGRWQRYKTSEVKNSIALISFVD